jgi:hypothetical protein
MSVQDKAASVGGLPRNGETGAIDYKEDFFGRPAHLTVSGQLEAEAYACALTRCVLVDLLWLMNTSEKPIPLQRVHVWADVSCGKLVHVAPFGRVLDD